MESKNKVLAINNGWNTFQAQTKKGLPIPLFVMKQPLVDGNTVIERGIMLIGNEILDALIEKHGEDLKKYWFIICTTQSHMISDNVHADLHLFSNTYGIREYLGTNAAHIPYLTLTCGHFVNPDKFFSDNTINKKYDAFYIAKWFSHKRIELLVDALQYLPQDFKVGLLAVPMLEPDRIEESNRYKEKVLSQITENDERLELIVAPEGAHINEDGSSVPGGFTKEEMREYINMSKVAVLLSDKHEGVNRAICEALCCDVPVLITNDTIGGTKNLVSKDTGELVDSTPQSVAEGILKIRENVGDYQPRNGFITRFGIHNAMYQIKKKVKEILDIKGESIDMSNIKDYGGDPWTLDYYKYVQKINY